MTTGPTNSILDHLNAQQLEAVTSTAKPLIIIAGAGSGKTRVLTRRIAYRVANSDAEARHTLAITFTRKAAHELNDRLKALDMRDKIETHTFHGAALRILQRYWESQSMTPLRLLDSKYRLVSQALTSIGTTTKSQAKKEKSPGNQLSTKVDNKSLIYAISSEIEWAKARCLSSSTYAQAAIAQNRVTPLTPSEVSEIFQNYEHLKMKSRQLDFDDLISQATWALNNDRTFQSQEHYRIRHLYVDEFQDVNTSQMRFIDAIMGQRNDLCVVGDPNQAIYTWNGADPSLIANLSQKYEQAKTVILSRNYRSTPQILAVASKALPKQIPKGQVAVNLEPEIPDGPIPTIRAYSDEKSESQAIARLVKRSVLPSGNWSEIAILARTNTQLLTYKKALDVLAIPNYISGETNLFSQSEIRDIVSHLEKGITAYRGTSLYIWLEETVTKATQNYSNNQAALDNLNLFLSLSREFLTSNDSADCRSLAIWLKAQAQNAIDESANDAVTLATFHKAKGLEWKTVFLVGMEDGYVPISRAETTHAVEEERRLLYVAITRAKHSLTFTWSRTRKMTERALRREPSPYLDEIQDEINRLTGNIATTEHALSAIRNARNNLTSIEENPPLSNSQLKALEELRVWRSNKAKELGVPSHLIAHDRTLNVLVRHQPADLEALGKIAGIGQVKASRYGTEILSILSH